MIRSLFAILSVVLFVGCTTIPTPSDPNSLRSLLEQWQGQSVQRALDAWGMPQGYAKKDGVYTFTWIKTIRDDQKRGYYYCTRTLITDKAGNIHASSFAGNKEAGCF